MKKFVNAFDYEIPHGEINDLPSETVPDMTMSLGEILKRYTRGGEVATFTPVYQNHDDFDENPEFEKMDATEKLQMALDLKMAIKRHQSSPPGSKDTKNSPDEPASPAVNQAPEGATNQAPEGASHNPT